ncbi:MAG TPA: hypothetical protein PKL52_01870 [Tenuifilaceae bacterium]|nr:hypothetical protein [Tenuifilaceae bacterium]
MVKLGEISFYTGTSTTGVDGWGHPLPTRPEWSSYYPCNIKAPRRELQEYDGGQYRRANYVILVDERFVGTADFSECKKVRLKDSRCKCIGTHQVISNTYQKLTRQIRIVV